MSDWAIKFPVKDRADDFALEYLDVVNDALKRGQLDEPEAEIAREIYTCLLLDDAPTPQTFGDAFDRLSQLGKPGRRQLLDDVRQRCGLESATEIDRLNEQRAIDRRHEGPQADQDRELRVLRGRGGSGIFFSCRQDRRVVTERETSIYPMRCQADERP